MRTYLASFVRANLVWLGIVFAGAFVPGGTARADVAEDHHRFVANAIDGYIRPEFRHFSRLLHVLDAQIGDFCAAPDAAGYEKMARAYSDALAGFARIGFLRFGPLIEDHRLERILFWPDRKSTGRRQAEQAVAEHDASVLTLNSLQGKSVAMQGLLALEPVLFDEAREALLSGGDDATFRCGYAGVIGANLAEMSDSIAAEWAAPDGYAALLLQPGPDNVAYRSDQEAASQVLGALTTGLQIVRDQWIGPILGSGPHRPKPRMALFRRSGNSLVMIEAAVGGLRDYLAALDIAPMLDEQDAWLNGSLQFELSNVLEKLRELKEPLTKTLRNPEAYDKLAFIDVVLNSVRDSASEELAIALKIQVGFNALDGD
ncbi:imelysin family protein [Breoghania sp. JC706]|uniref:imelysin family protein n=1 Tax=Breoghania sp. JC706 TaxID=3117732 RepID=UPI003008E5E9